MRSFATQLNDERRNEYTRQRFLGGALGLSAAAAGLAAAAPAAAAGQRAGRRGSPAREIWDRLADGEWEVVDLSVTTAPDYPTNFPPDPQFDVIPLAGFQPIPGKTIQVGKFAVQRYEVTEHTATQVDFPPHFIPPPGVPVEGAPSSPEGLHYGDQYPLEELMGRAVVVDARGLLASHNENGTSVALTRRWLRDWERRYGRFEPGDVPLIYSEYTDRYYQRFPDGDRTKDRMLWAVLVAKSAPGWVAVEPAATELLNERGVRHIVTDAPSYGAAEDPQPGHVAGLKYGMTWTEQAANLGSLPRRGGLYVCAPYKVRDQQAGIVRAFAFKATADAGLSGTRPLRL